MNVKFKYINDTNWVKGHVDDYTFQAQLFDEGSRFGIEEGRVSRLNILDRDDKCIANYDRGWDIEPESEEHINIFDTIIFSLENSPKQFE